MLRRPSAERPASTGDLAAVDVDSASGPRARSASDPGADPSQPAVELREVTKTFERVVAVDGVDLTIPAGCFYSLLGPSGSGKTTCLRLIAGFEEPDAGHILIHGTPVDQVPSYRRDVNTVFQHYALFPHMDVTKNVGYGLRQRRPRIDHAEIERRTSGVLALVRLEGLEHRRVWELSGGQQQRVALARALVNEPQVLLLDEPLGALDLKLRKQMQLELKRIQQEVGITFIHVTHDQEEALAMSDRIAIMVDGAIAQEGTPRELYHEPRTRFVADFVGECNFVDGRVVEAEAKAGGRHGVAILTEPGVRLNARSPAGGRSLSAGDRATIAIRPEYVGLRPVEHGDEDEGAVGLVGTIVETTFLGDHVRYLVRAAGLGDLFAHATGGPDPSRSVLAPGQEVSVTLDELGSLAIASEEGDRPWEDGTVPDDG
jgi:spermidine/putrescine transport system ATP-binding protein